MTQILGKQVGPIGYGLMGSHLPLTSLPPSINSLTRKTGFTWRPNPPPLDQALEAMRTAVLNGCTLWNGAEFYGTPEYNSMTLLKHYFTKHPEDADKVTLFIKGGQDVRVMAPDGSPEGVRRSLDNILAQLGGVKKLDAFAYARRDAKTSFETTLSVIQKEYIDTGKIGGVYLSECSAETVHEATKYAKILAAEVELSMFTPDIIKNGVAAACAEYGIPILAYSPIGRGVSNPAHDPTTSLFNTADFLSDAHRTIHRSRALQRLWHHLPLPTLPARRLRAQPQPRRASPSPRQGEKVQPRAVRHRLGQGAERARGDADGYPHPGSDDFGARGGECEGCRAGGGGFEGHWGDCGWV